MYNVLLSDYSKDSFRKKLPQTPVSLLVGNLHCQMGTEGQCFLHSAAVAPCAVGVKCIRRGARSLDPAGDREGHSNTVLDQLGVNPCR